MADRPEQDEKTEEPTHKKLEDARKKGDVAKSQEVNSWFMMLAATLFILILSKNMAASLTLTLKGFFSHAHALPMDEQGIQQVMKMLGLGVLGALALPFLLMMIGGLCGNLVQHGFLFTVEPVKPKLSKISVLQGAKRLFSAIAVMNFVKSLAKLVIVSAVMALIIWPDRSQLDALLGLDPASLLEVVLSLAAKVLIGVLSILTIVAAIDYAFQRQTWWKKQRMTMKELRDEYKQLEGDPQVRAKLRQVRIERGRKRMMANVPKAAVVITNPTHYSIALQYDTGMPAPICVAKGVDAVALKIREVANENDIPLVENPPLARTLYASVEIDEEIPPEHYKAVAEVIGYVMRIKEKVSNRHQ